MCLSVPARLVSISDGSPVESFGPLGSSLGSSLTRTGKVSLGGVLKEISLAYVPEAKVGDYVLVHVGFAISIVDEREAQFVFDYLKSGSEEGTKEWP